MSAEQVSHFRSRYTEDDISPFLPQNQLQPAWWKTTKQCARRCLACYRCICGSRRRMIFSLLFVAAAVELANQVTALYLWLVPQSTVLSNWQSYGLLLEPNWKWQSRQHLYASIHSKIILADSTTTTLLDDPAAWFETYGQEDFHCPVERSLGATSFGGGDHSNNNTTTTNNDSILNKWYLCNPTRIAQHHRKCLVYTTGRPDPLHQLEHALLQHLAKPCELHIFDPSAAAVRETTIRTNNNVTSTITIHSWGLTGSNAASAAAAATFADNKIKTFSSSRHLLLKSLAETWQLLKHGHRTLDVLVLDCAGCEWDVYADLVDDDDDNDTASPILPQHVLMQIHAFPPSISNATGESNNSNNHQDYNEILLQHMSQQRYVRFHRVPQVWHGQQMGHAQAYSFLRLRHGFFAP